MPNDVVHFAINADDCERAKNFYETVFGWRFEPWGPPDFWQVVTSPDGIRGALHRRHEELTGTGSRGYDCTIRVQDIEAVLAKLKAAGGKIVSPPFLIENVGTVARFEDTEGNHASVMEYLEGVI